MNYNIRLKSSILILLLLLFTSVQSNERVWIPNGYKSWADSGQSSKQKILLGGPVQHYCSIDSVWQKIDNSWINNNDTLFSVRKSVLKTDVYPDGKSQVSLTVGSTNIVVTQKMIRLILLNNVTGNWRTIDSVINNNDRTIDGNIIYWKNYFDNIDYAVIKENGRLQHRIYFTPKFLDSLISRYLLLQNSEQFYLANVIEYSLSNIDSLRSTIDLNQRILKKIGKESFKLSSQHLFYNGWDTLQTIYVKQKWLIKNSKLYCIEYVPMQQIAEIYQNNPNETIWHNDSQEFDYSDCEDTYIRDDFPDRNQGINAALYPIVSVTTSYAGFLKFDLSNIPSNAIIDSSWMTFQFTTYSRAHDLCRMLTDWDEGTEVTDIIDNTGEHGATYNYAKDDYDNANWNWANDTSFSALDYDDNSGNYYGQIASSSTQLQDTLFVGSPQSGNMSDLIQKWVDSTYQNYGFGLRGTTSNAQIRSANVIIVSMRPKLYVEWTIPSEQNSSNRRRKLNNIRR